MNKIQISQLFDEIDRDWCISTDASAHENETLHSDDDFELSNADIRAIQASVNRTLNVIPLERKRYMKQKMIKSIVAVALLAALSTVTVFAATNIDLLKEFFIGDTSSVQKQVLTPGTTGTDGEFKVTVDQVLSDEHNALIIASVEALTEDAKKLLHQKYAFFAYDMSLAVPDGASISYSGASGRNMKEQNTPDKLYYELDITNLNNPNKDSLILYPNKETHPNLYAEVPLKSDLETIKVKLNAPSAVNGQAFSVTQVDLTPLGLYIQLSAPVALHEFPASLLFFRMKDGTIQTQNQLLDLGSTGGHQKWNDANGDDAKGTVITLTGRFCKVIDPAEITGIIVGTTEYPISNAKKTKQVTIDPTLLPFEFIPVVEESEDTHLVVPVRAFCDKLGADLTWNEEAKTAIIHYRGDVIELTVGKDIALRNGQTIQKLSQPVSFLNGILISDVNFVNYGLNVDLFRTNSESKNPYDWTWIVTP